MIIELHPVWPHTAASGYLININDLQKTSAERDFLACGAALLEWSVISFGCLQKKCGEMTAWPLY